jgi:hypothetical protein
MIVTELQLIFLIKSFQALNPELHPNSPSPILDQEQPNKNGPKLSQTGILHPYIREPFGILERTLQSAKQSHLA